MLKAAVFDLDGTLVYSKIDYIKARAEVDEYLKKNGAPKEYLEKKPIFVTLDRVINYFREIKINERFINKIKKEVDKIVSKYEQDAAKKTELMPNVKDTLKKIRDLGLKLGLFTINNKKVTKYVLKKYKLIEYFDSIISREDTPKIKPEKEHFLEVLKNLDVKPKDTVVVGDTIYDFMASKELGAIGIGIEGLYQANQLYSDAKVDYVIKDINEIIAIIKNLNLNTKNLIN